MNVSFSRFAIVAALALAACAPHRVATSSSDRAAARTGVEAMLAHGARTWNAGDLDEFVSDYEDSATFVGSRGILHGRPLIRGAYASRFAPGAQRDSLHFEGLEVDLLAPDVGNAIAFYVLMRGDSVTARGPTSLVVRRSGGRWRIVHDHSS